MPKRSRKQRLPDPNVTAFEIVQQLSGEATPEPAAPAPDGKNPAAVALGKLGGAKGGKARAAAMTKKQRSEAARKAARARWGGRAKTRKSPTESPAAD